MPYSNNSELPSGVKDNLPAEAQTVYRKAFNNSFEGTCKGDEGCAARIAWSAVKRGWKKEGDTWVRKSVVEFSLFITKAFHDEATGKNRWVATCSNTQEDAYKTHMTVELFRDFIHRIDGGEKAPEMFRSRYWSGGLPYLSVAHYEDLDGWATAGETEVLYIDGEYLKAKGTFADTEVGRALYQTVSKELKERPERPIRISIAFADYGHRHGLIEWERKSLTEDCPMCREGLGEIYFTKGLLVHLAATRIPANEDTGFGLEERSMTTREEDAASIVGEELAEKMDKKSLLVGKSMAGEDKTPALIVRGEDESSSASVTVPAETVIEGEEESEVERAKKREDITPADKKAAEAKYGNVTYADETNKKYPIDTEEHIRAAWNYINKEKDAAKYSPAEVASIKKKIVAAWKKKIDPAGPPSAAQKKSMDEEMKMPEVAMPAPEPGNDFSFGGAVTLDAVKQYLTASNEALLLRDIWTYAEECMYNIIQRPDIEDKSKAIRELMAGFSTEWKKAMEVKESLTEENPLDQAFVALRSKVEEIRNSPQFPTPEDKLVAVQEHFEAFGGAVKNSFIEPEDAITVEEEQKIQKYLEPLRQENQELRSKVDELIQTVQSMKVASVPVPEKRTVVSPEVPQRRSYQRAPVKMPGTPRDPQKPRSVREIVRTNQGLPL